MALLDITVDQLDSDLRIQDDAVAYVESSTGIRKHFRYMGPGQGPRRDKLLPSTCSMTPALSPTSSGWI